MDDYRTIEVRIAKKYGVEANFSRKSIGDFFIDNDITKPVNVNRKNKRNDQRLLGEYL